MCSVSEDIEELSIHRKAVQTQGLRNFKKCKKCNEQPLILLQKKDPFCKKCFYEYCDHKFRSTIGKTKKIKHGDKVLLACSGGRKSTALLHMTKKALDSASAKQISFNPAILFLNESACDSEPTDDKQQQILRELKNFGYPVLYTSLVMVCELNNGHDFYCTVDSTFSPESLHRSCDSSLWLKNCIYNMSLSSKVDFIKHLRLLLLTEVAHHAGYKYVFVGDTACNLASNLLSDISLGRGSQISANTNFLDSRYKVPICRPLREFLNKEVVLYIHLNNCSYFVLPDLLTKTDVKSSVQRLAEAFISNLQVDFPATVFTIFRTGGKLLKQSNGTELETCFLCKSKLDNFTPDPCSALEALKLSQRISEISPSNASTSTALEHASPASGNATDEALNIYKYLCHGCSLPFRNKKQTMEYLPMLKESIIQMKREDMKEEIKDYLLDEEEML